MMLLLSKLKRDVLKFPALMEVGPRVGRQFFGGLSIKSFIDHRYLDGVLVTLFLWSRFYHGGIENAGKAAYKYNEEKKSAYIEEMIEKYGQRIVGTRTQIDADKHR